MDAAENVGFSRFPRQSDWVGRRVVVCFDFDPSCQMEGTFVRCDDEEPGVAIIRLDDGRHVLTTECMYRMPK